MTIDVSTTNQTVKPHIWFQLIYSLGREIFPSRNEDLPLTLVWPDDLELVFSAAKGEPGQSIPRLQCSALCRRKLNSKLLSHFESLAAGVLPIDSTSSIALPHTIVDDAQIDEHGHIPEGFAVRLEWLPINFQNFYDDVNLQLSSVIRSYVNTLRWVQDIPCKHNPFSFRAFGWSFDKELWRSMPGGISVGGTVHRGVKLTELNQVTALWTNNQGEPMAHELLREAFDVLPSNPRSALLIGVTALETGLKHFIDYLIPNAAILLEKMPSPSALTMIRDVIPELQKQTNHPIWTLAKTDLDTVRKWIELRNKVAHGSHRKLASKEVEAFLVLIQRVLYELDYHRGHEWVKNLNVLDPPS